MLQTLKTKYENNFGKVGNQYLLTNSMFDFVNILMLIQIIVKIRRMISLNRHQNASIQINIIR